MNQLVILNNHPYFDVMRPSIRKMSDGAWQVKWRDFQTMKQDVEFATEGEAMAFAARLTTGPKVVGDEWDDPSDLADANAFWCGMVKWPS